MKYQFSLANTTTVRTLNSYKIVYFWSCEVIFLECSLSWVTNGSLGS